MNHLRWVRLAVVALFVALGSADLSAQGLTTSGINGRVMDEAGNPVPSAQVAFRNLETGVAGGVIANATGSYFIANLEPGGPYLIEVSSIGYATQSRDDIRLTLGQNYKLDWALSQQAVEIAGIEITVEQNEIFSAERSGQQTIVTSQQIDDLPTQTRNFTELAALSPLASAGTGSTTVMGANNRLNNIQIDGAVNNDAFGLAASGVPGGQANGKPVSQDAIKEFQIMVAPFDVRQSGFTGGLINAVTKSGTNEWHGSLFANYKSEGLQQSTLEFNDATFDNSEFTNFMLSGTLGGPIVRDKAHFFANIEVENRDFPNPIGIENQTGMDANTISRIGQIAEQQYGLDFGRATVYKNKNPALNLFGRVDWSLNQNHRLSFKYTHASADLDDSPSRSNGNFFEPESATYDFTNRTNTLVGQLFSQIGATWSNEALVTFQAIRDKRAPAPEFGYSTIVVDNPDDPVDDGATVQFGAERFSHANALDQNILQITDNLTGNFGDHRATFGINFESWGFVNLFADRSLGQYEFDSIEDFEAGNASFYALRILHPDFATGGSIEDAAAEFTYTKLGLYAQDEWRPNNEFTLTYGLRVDIPFTGDEPRNNNDFLASFGFPTTEVPSGNPAWQPRVAFNWQPRTAQRSQLRGGVGMFAGRPAFVWMSNAFGNTGRETVELRCTGSNVPSFSPKAPPASCADGSGAAAARASIAVVDPDFKFPSELRANLGYDREFGDQWRFTIEGSTPSPSTPSWWRSSTRDRTRWDGPCPRTASVTAPRTARPSTRRTTPSGPPRSTATTSTKSSA